MTLLPLWRAVLQRIGYEVRVVGAVRDPLSVARSLHARDGLPIAHGACLFASNWGAAARSIGGLRCSFVRYDAVLDDARAELLRIASELRIGLPQEFFPAGLNADVEAAVRAALAQLEKLGARLVPVSLPRTELSIPVYYIIAPAEASSNLSRFDGVKFGHRAAKYGDLVDMYQKTRSEGFGPEVQRRIMIGTYVLSHGYYDAYYIKAQQIRRLIAQDFQQAFAQCDLIAGPVAPSVAWKIGEKGDDPVANYLADIYTLSTSLAGLPGMSVPAGFGADGLPVGLQLVGNYLKEAELLQAAHAFQQATDWHTRTAQGF